MAVCVVCEWAEATKAKRCGTCYAYRRRNGRDRPEELIVAHGRRLLEEELEARCWGRRWR